MIGQVNSAIELDIRIFFLAGTLDSLATPCLKIRGVCICMVLGTPI